MIFILKILFVYQENYIIKKLLDGDFIVPSSILYERKRK